MSDGRSLISMLARVRRRLRLLAALEGAVVAATAAALGLAVCFLVVRARGGALGGAGVVAAFGAAFGLVGIGLLAGAVRRIPLERCARLLDRALDGNDRVLSALAFTLASAARAGWAARAADDGRSAFAAAAIRDALRRATAVAPATAAPFRRPTGVLDLALGVAVVALAALIPAAARGSRPPARSQASMAAREPGFHIDRSALDAERDEAAEAMQAATALDDPRLETLAREMTKALAAINSGELPQGEVLQRLADLQRRGEEAADDAAALQRQLEKAGRSLRDSAATREAGRAVEAGDPAATEKALGALADKAAEAHDTERSGLASSLERAAAQARAAADPAAQTASAPAATPPAGAKSSANKGADQNEATAPSEERQRRLARDGNPAAPADDRTDDRADARAPNGERRLERLDQDLEEAAAACRANPEACRRRLDQAAHDLPRMERQASSAESRRRLAQAVQQLRERLRRDGEGQHAGDSPRQKAERRFMRSARGEGNEAEADKAAAGSKKDPSAGEPGAPNEGGARGESGAGDSVVGAAREDGDDEAGADKADGAGHDPAAGGNGAVASSSAAGSATSAPGEGFGSQNGGDPLGAAGELTARGRLREAHVAGSSGPSRSEIIQSAARRGFAHARYGGVFDDYHAAVEDSLDAGDVPPGRRYVVRRYFQLIRPIPSRVRPATTSPPPPPPSPSPSSPSR